MIRTAVIAGASGLVGRLCLEMLFADETYGQVLALGGVKDVTSAVSKASLLDS